MSMQDFDEMTRANMEVALERACRWLPADKVAQHPARSHVAGRILAVALTGQRSLTKLTDAGRRAAIELTSAH